MLVSQRVDRRSTVLGQVEPIGIFAIVLRYLPFFREILLVGHRLHFREVPGQRDLRRFWFCGVCGFRCRYSGSRRGRDRRFCRGLSAARQQKKQSKGDEIPFFHGSSSFSDWVVFQSFVLFLSVDDQNLFRYYCIISGCFCQYFTNQFSDVPFKSAI